MEITYKVVQREEREGSGDKIALKIRKILFKVKKSAEIHEF